MSIRVEFNGSTASIILSGGIDYSKQEEFGRVNDRALSAEGVTEILFDFADVSFLDSSGIRALISMQRRANAGGKLVTILNCNEYLREIFEIGGFDSMFTFR